MDAQTKQQMLRSIEVTLELTESVLMLDAESTIDTQPGGAVFRHICNFTGQTRL